MKVSLIISILIVAAACFFGWKDHRQLAAARENHVRLLEHARALGLDSDRLLDEGQAALPTKLARGEEVDRAAIARDFAKRLAALAGELKANEESGLPHGEDMHERIFAMLDELLHLDASQLKLLVAELRADPDFDEGIRKHMVGLAITTLAKEHPQAALALFTEFAATMDDEDIDKHVLSSALATWAQKDPMAALEWIGTHAAKHPGLADAQAKRGVISGAARQDPRLAFQLIDELGLDPSNAGGGIAGSAETPAERTAVMLALREHLMATGDAEAGEKLRASIVSGLGREAALEGYDSAVHWFESAGLSDEETALLARSLNPWQVRDDPGKWLDWMDGTLSGGELDGKVSGWVNHWTREDFRAAGDWINTAADGPAKRAAVKSYAATVAPYEPASAAQWALTLPSGDERDELLVTIHAEWQKQDEAAAADFATEQGIAE